ncbi:putative DNA-binding transcriptional regulator YafY [Kineococcus radiotolerans]|uniref:Putative DNA-binding transcriptional regulator YafY n=1 Tax=Kineococcus radiotolerans TaxID=131568 RepID=A0A7W4TJM2_KINRA|nr:WYL domain-containing protein [Kineococcus radiotolerans]MBB2899516.1 putative DNA-binding transcriptional regulator YafY [Kineococcus radiotolerans]
MATTSGTPATPATSSGPPGGAAAAARGARRTERLLNLVIALSATRRWLTKEQIRTAVPQYADCATTVAFERMFERDKEDLRELGVPLETGGEDPLFEDEAGYRIDREAYALPEIRFTPGELAVLSLASRVWQQASLAGPATRALVKLRSLGVEPDESSLIGVEPRVRTAEPAFDPLYAATRDRTPVSFTYRRAGGEPATRHVEPWAIVSWHGRWYLVGHDRDRDDSRVFRLSRVASAVKRIGRAGSYEVPEGIDPREIVAGTVGPTTTRRARLLVRSGAGLTLRRRARTVEAGEREDVVVVDVSDVEMSADELAAYGADVVVLEPPELREAVLRRLRGAAGQPAADSAGGPA